LFYDYDRELYGVDAARSAKFKSALNATAAASAFKVLIPHSPWRFRNRFPSFSFAADCIRTTLCIESSQAAGALEPCGEDACHAALLRANTKRRIPYCEALGAEGCDSRLPSIDRWVVLNQLDSMLVFLKTTFCNKVTIQVGLALREFAGKKK